MKTLLFFLLLCAVVICTGCAGSPPSSGNLYSPSYQPNYTTPKALYSDMLVEQAESITNEIDRLDKEINSRKDNIAIVADSYRENMSKSDFCVFKKLYNQEVDEHNKLVKQHNNLVKQRIEILDMMERLLLAMWSKPDIDFTVINRPYQPTYSNPIIDYYDSQRAHRQRQNTQNRLGEIQEELRQMNVRQERELFEKRMNALKRNYDFGPFYPQ